MPTYGDNFISGYVLLNVGKNNMHYEVSTAQEVMDATIAMYNYIRPFFKRPIMLNQYPNTAATDGSISLIKQYNALLAQNFGIYCVDNYGYLMGDQVWIDAGITPTSADRAAQAKGVIAPSLSSDGLHMNTAISQLVVDKLIKPLMQNLWFS